MRLGQPSKTQLVEFGPGRGTLMSDMLRVSQNDTPHDTKVIQQVYLIDFGTVPSVLQDIDRCSFD